MPGAFEALQRLKQEHELVVVTSRQHAIEGPTHTWLQAHYPGIFSDVHFGNHFALAGTSRKKSEICAAINAHVLIDDNPQYALDCAHAGVQVLLYNWNMGYPWSVLADELAHPNISVVRHWGDVEDAISRQAATAKALEE